MNSIFIIISSGLVGAGVGYLVGDWVSYQMQVSYFRGVIDDMIEKSEPMEISMKIGESTISAKTEVANNGKPATNYAKITKSGEKPNLDELVKEVVEYSTTSSPEIISEEDFENSPLEYMDVIYYADDGVFVEFVKGAKNVEEMYSIIDNPENVFGPNSHLHFGESGDDPDVVYIYSPSEAMCYSITRVDSSYKKEVLGVTEVEEKKESKAAPKRRARAAAKVEKEDKEAKNADNES